jgi:small-conductance mechanosensitive channel
MEVLERDWLGNPVRDWVLAVVLGLIVSAALRAVLHVLVRRLSKFASGTENFWDDVAAAVLRATRMWFLAIVAVLVGALVLALPPDLEVTVRRIAAVGLIVQGGVWAAAGLTAWLTKYREVRMKDDPAAATTVGAIGFVGKIVVWSLVLLLGLQNLGVNVTALVAGLGVGGIAVALAAQSILGDLFASISIVLDKPFVLGDFVVLDSYSGTVEHVGLKTTRIRSITGEQIVFSNADLLESRLRNFGRLKERRIVFAVGVTYGTTREKLERIPQILRDAVESVDRTRFDRAHFKSFGGSSLDFEIAYFVSAPEYNIYMDAQQAINLFIFRSFQEEGIEFAYPTQTLYVIRPEEPSGVDETHRRADDEEVIDPSRRG